MLVATLRHQQGEAEDGTRKHNELQALQVELVEAQQATASAQTVVAEKQELKHNRSPRGQ